jgi:hypothetical protein
MFNLPSFPRYISGLVIVLILAAIIFFAQSTLGLAQLNTYAALVIGLLLGHLLGSVIDRPAVALSTSDATDTGSDTKTLYVGNIAFSARRHELEKLFSRYGNVQSIRIVTDRETRRPRGYGFVEMAQRDAHKAIGALDGFEFKGRNLRVNEANERARG